MCVRNRFTDTPRWSSLWKYHSTKKKQSLSIRRPQIVIFFSSLFRRMQFKRDAILFAHSMRACARMRAFMHSFFSPNWETGDQTMSYTCVRIYVTLVECMCVCLTPRFVMLNIFLFRVVLYHTAHHIWHPQSETRTVPMFNSTVWLWKIFRWMDVFVFIILFSFVCWIVNSCPLICMLSKFSFWKILPLLQFIQFWNFRHIFCKFQNKICLKNASILLLFASFLGQRKSSITILWWVCHMLRCYDALRILITGGIDTNSFITLDVHQQVYWHL